MIVYLASPRSAVQADKAQNMPVLFSFACYADWLDKYQQSFSRILIDSGAYSAMTQGKKIDVHEYHDWTQRWIPHADAIAGLDDINGNWKKSLKNYDVCGFPTIHDTDPPELLDDLIPIARERGGWIGVGLKPPRQGKEKWVRETLDRIPDDLHVHGWALRAYTHCRRIDTVDSTAWFRRPFDLRVHPMLDHLTYAECLEIVVKRYKRWNRKIIDPKKEAESMPLFAQENS